MVWFEDWRWVKCYFIFEKVSSWFSKKSSTSLSLESFKRCMSFSNSSCWGLPRASSASKTPGSFLLQCITASLSNIYWRISCLLVLASSTFCESICLCANGICERSGKFWVSPPPRLPSESLRFCSSAIACKFSGTELRLYNLIIVFSPRILSDVLVFEAKLQSASSVLAAAVSLFFTQLLNLAAEILTSSLVLLGSCT